MRQKRLLFAAGLFWSVAAISAFACIPLPAAGAPERYARGDLLTQIAENAEVIQIVRAGTPEPVDAELAAQLGAWLPHEGRSFELSVVRTLAAVPLSRRDSFKVTGVPVDPSADQTSWQYGLIDQRESVRDGALTDPQLLPGPMSGGFEDIEHMTNCQSPFLIAPGDLFIALRARNGALYVTTQPDGRRLPIDIDVPSPRGWIRGGESPRAVPGLLRIEGFDDPLLLRLLTTVNDASAEREAMNRRARWDAIFLLVFGNRAPTEADW